MMRLYVLGSGSRGNAFAVEVDGEALLLDVGFSAREIERRAAAVGLDLGRVTAIALTHEHGSPQQDIVPFLGPQIGNRRDDSTAGSTISPGSWFRRK